MRRMRSPVRSWMALVSAGAAGGVPGSPAPPIFGAFSSTATSMLYARYYKENSGMLRLSAVVILIANLVVLVRIAVESAVVSPQIVPHLLPVLATGLIFGLAGTLLPGGKLQFSEELPLPKTANPTELHAALGFGLLYALVVLCSAWLSDIAGSKGLYAVALVSGLTDVDAITLSSLHLLDIGKLSENHVVVSITLAYLSNLMFKFGLVVFIGGKALARKVSIGFAAMAVGVILGLLFF